MNVEEIKTALDLAQCELRSAYKKLGYTSSNVLDIIDKCLADLSNPINNDLHIPAVSESYFACDVCGCHPSVIIRTAFGAFCELHAKYVR